MTTRCSKESKHKPIDRRWLMNTIGPLWLILGLGTAGLFVVIEWLVYDIIDLWHGVSPKETP